MTQFKDRAAEQDFVSAGLFTYPVLMAGDILLYQTDLVPVGDDQRQHVELTRDIAERFNQRFGQTFVVPEVSIPEDGARIRNLQEPERLMSTTRGAPQGVVRLVDPPETVRKKFKTAVTDSGSDVRHDPAEKAGISNLIEIMAVATGDSIPEIEARYDGQGYGRFKQDVAEAVVELLDPDPAALRGASCGRVAAAIDARRRRREGPRRLRAHARADVRAHGFRPSIGFEAVTDWTAGARSFRFAPGRANPLGRDNEGESEDARSRACRGRHFRRGSPRGDCDHQRDVDARSCRPGICRERDDSRADDV